MLSSFIHGIIIPVGTTIKNIIIDEIQSTIKLLGTNSIFDLILSDDLVNPLPRSSILKQLIYGVMDSFRTISLSLLISNILNNIFKGILAETNQELTQNNSFLKMCIIMPIVEEIIFRGAIGYILNSTKISFLIKVMALILGCSDYKLTIVINNTIFALTHLINCKSINVAYALLQVLNIMLKPSLSIMYYRYGLLASIISHIIHNSLSDLAFRGLNNNT